MHLADAFIQSDLLFRLYSGYTYFVSVLESIFFEEWKYKGIWAIANCLDDKGNVLLQREFCEKFQLQCTVNIYNIMINIRIRDFFLFLGFTCFIPVLVPVFPFMVIFLFLFI